MAVNPTTGMIYVTNTESSNDVRFESASHSAIDAQIQHSLDTPMQSTISSDGGTVYISIPASAPSSGRRIVSILRLSVIDPASSAEIGSRADSIDSASIALGSVGGLPNVSLATMAMKSMPTNMGSQT